MNYERLTKEHEDACLQNISYNRAQLQADTHSLRRWLKEQAHLPESKMKESDAFLRNFLVGCKGSLEKSKRKIDNYYSFKNSACPFFKDYDATTKKMLETRQAMSMGFLPTSLKDGTRVSFYRPNYLLSSSHYVHFFSLALMLLELELRREDIWPLSIILVFDLEETKVEEAVKTNPLHVRDYFYILQEILPFRIKMLIYLNMKPAIVHVVNYLVKPFLSKKLNERVHVYSSGWENITQYIPAEIMPKDCDIGLPSHKSITDNFYEVLEDKREWFLTDLSEKTDESKRPPTSKRAEHPYFGVDGSFKSLHID